MVLNCSHWYCSSCGTHKSSDIRESHKPDCPELERALRLEEFWRDSKKRQQGEDND